MFVVEVAVKKQRCSQGQDWALLELGLNLKTLQNHFLKPLAEAL